MSKSRHNLMIVLISVLMLIAAACGQAPATPPEPAPTLAPRDEQRTLTVGDLDRSYHLHLPPGLSSDQPVPLVFVFHGYQMSGTLMRSTSGFDRVANEHGFVVVYPNGIGYTSTTRSWNGGGCCGIAHDNNHDEAAFVTQILADLEGLVTLDPARIYAAGFSNGGLLSYRLACEMSGTFAAISPVGAPMLFSPCQPQEAVSLIHVHGSRDPLVPIAGGGTNPVSGEPFPPVAQGVEFWAEYNGCGLSPEVEESEYITHSTYGPCQDGIAVEYYIAQGIAHDWPRSPFTASEVIWEFFAAHPKP